MARARTVFVCSACGYESPKWLGRCQDCGEWNTLAEESRGDRPPGGRRGSGRDGGARKAPVPQVLDSVEADRDERLSTGSTEFDRVLGGGLMDSSLVLVGGEPGIGKSTLLLQVLMSVQRRGVSGLLICGEESPAQVKLRAERLRGGTDGLRVLAETRTEYVISCLEEHRPEVCVVDSVQTMWSEEVQSAPGSISQVREATGQLLRAAKDIGVTLVLVGHVTKDGALAGPRVLEHMVDAVVSFEGDREMPFRLIRATKNRFGSTNEVGVFRMTGDGLVEVEDPSALFLEEGKNLPGSAVVAALEGTRCILAEVQALVTPTNLTVPRRVGRGVDKGRMSMVVAVLTRRAGLRLSETDVFVNVSGGLKVEDPGTDVPVALAIGSALRDRSLPEGVAAFGELSLTGQVRYASQADKRVRELARRGFTRIIVPERNMKELEGGKNIPSGVRLEPAVEVRELIRATVD